MQALAKSHVVAGVLLLILGLVLCCLAPVRPVGVGLLAISGCLLLAALFAMFIGDASATVREKLAEAWYYCRTYPRVLRAEQREYERLRQESAARLHAASLFSEIGAPCLWCGGSRRGPRRTETYWVHNQRYARDATPPCIQCHGAGRVVIDVKQKELAEELSGLPGWVRSHALSSAKALGVWLLAASVFLAAWCLAIWFAAAVLPQRMA